MHDRNAPCTNESAQGGVTTGRRRTLRGLHHRGGAGHYPSLLARMTHGGNGLQFSDFLYWSSAYFVPARGIRIRPHVYPWLARFSVTAPASGRRPDPGTATVWLTNHVRRAEGRRRTNLRDAMKDLQPIATWLLPERKSGWDPLGQDDARRPSPGADRPRPSL